MIVLLKMHAASKIFGKINLKAIKRYLLEWKDNLPIRGTPSLLYVCMFEYISP